MTERRPRLTSDDVSLIVSSLKARAAMCTGERLRRVHRLIERFEDVGVGNPSWRFAGEDKADFDERLAQRRAQLAGK